MKKKLYVFIIVFIASIVILGFSQDYYFKINKSFDLIGAIFREINSNYVIETDPEILARGAIEGMISTLDPYTEYYDSSNQNDFDILTTGSYTGFGFILRNIDSVITVIEVADKQPAKEAGIQVGDKIISIDGTKLPIDLDKDFQDVFRGELGSKSVIKLVKFVTKDTIELTLTRKNIQIDNIFQSELLDSNIAFIKLDVFKQNTAFEFKTVLNELKRKANGKLNGLIIDLRNNGGGLMRSATNILEMFLPYGSELLTTKGRNPEDMSVEKSTSIPSEPDLPLCILINENTASASEILAGALQEYDRAVVVGSRSFGKALVQRVLPLPYKTNLKITTSRYYTPLGRHIQKQNFGNNYKYIMDTTIKADTVTFFTKNGRKLYQLNGIEPDTNANNSIYSYIIYDLYEKDMFLKFAEHYFISIKSKPKNVVIDDKIFEQFNKWLISNSYSYKSESDELLERLNEISLESNYSKAVQKQINNLQKEVSKISLAELRKNKKDVMMELDYIFKLINNDIGYKRAFLNKDNNLNLSISLLKNNIYKRILNSN